MHLFINIIKRVSLVLLAVVPFSSCIYDKYHTVQFSITADAVGDDGKTLSDRLIDSKRIFFFVNGRYYDGLVPGSDGSYQVSFPEGAQYTFVAAGSEDSTAFRFTEPVDGDNINNQYVEVLDYDNIPAVYWGSVTSDGRSESVHVEMTDVRGRVHVLVRNLRNRFGDGIYNVIIGGLRKGLTYSGEACGNMVERKRNGAFQSGADLWLSEELITLPTAPNEGITIRLQRDNGEQIGYFEVDDEGNQMLVNKGVDVVFVISLLDRVGFSITVAPWSDVFSEFIF